MNYETWMKWQSRFCWVLLYAWLLDWVPWYVPHMSGLLGLIIWSQWKLRILRAERVS